MKIDYRNRVVVLTGGSSGIGAAMALELAKRGAKLALVGRNKERLLRVRDQAQSLGSEAEYFVCDVTNRVEGRAAVKQILKRFDRVDVLVYSSGIGVPTFYRQFDAATIRKIHETNLLGFVDWLEFVLPGMQKRHWGVVVGISSLAAHLSTKRTVGYTSSKAALSNFLVGVRQGLRKYGVRVLTVEPGYVKTPMTADNPNMIFPMEVEKAARKIVWAMEHGKKTYRFPKILAWAVRFWECLPTNLKEILFRG